ncbi:MAG: class I SAM-dependent methyltransferase [Thermoanaerobaculaceae bacterium]
MDLDDPRTTELRRRVVRAKGLLRRVYAEWYERLAGALPPGEGPVLELGSGAGFLAEHVPRLITSELLITPHVGLAADAMALPFPPGHLRGIVMTNVLHHIPQPRQLLAEAARCVGFGGVVAMVEPWMTPWSRLVYRRLHHEPCDDRATEWEFPPGGPLSASNQALPWILFARDRTRFELEQAAWQVESVEPIMPFSYLLSGGLAWRSALPGWAFGPLRACERLIERRGAAMFAFIVLRRARPPEA